jgi:hypothetical protein
MSDLAKKAFELFSKPETVAEVESKPAEEQPLSSIPPWPCRHCGKPAEIEEVQPSFDGTRALTLWHCEPCQTWGVTPDTVRQSPVWVSKREQ